MPPAFNLSQDQTLQFNTCTRLHSLLTSTKPNALASSFVTSPTAVIAARPASFSMSTSRDACRAPRHQPTSPTRVAPSFTSNQSPRATITPSTHTYRLFTLLKSVRAPGRAPTQDSVEQRDAIIIIRPRF